MGQKRSLRGAGSNMDVGEYKKMYEVEDNHFWFVGKRMFVGQFLNRYINKPSLKILDIGSGTGGMTRWLEKYGEVVGVERNRKAIEYSKRRGLNIVQGNATKLPFKENTFDLVTVFDVLYHKNIKDDVGVLSEVHRVLSPGGLMMITDSAVPWLYGDHDVVMQARERYSLKDLSSRVENSGFGIIKKSYLFFFLFPLVLIKRLFRNKQNKSDVDKAPVILNIVLIILTKFEAYGLRYFSYPIGSSVGILARKKRK